jgi:predicted transcriptional regulator
MHNATPQNTRGAEIISLPVTKKDKRRAEHKYSAPVMKHGYTMLPNLLLQAQGRLNISHAQFNILVQLIGHWWDADKEPHPAKDTIARRMGKSPRQIQRYLTELEEAGLIKRIKRFKGHKAQTTNGYALDGLVAKLKEIEPQFQKRSSKGNCARRGWKPLPLALRSFTT